MMRPLLLGILFCTNFTLVLAQDSTHFLLHIVPTFQGEDLVLNKNYYYQNDSIRFETLKFYIGNIFLSGENEQNSCFENNYFLIDAENPASYHIELPCLSSQQYQQIGFTVGVDSLTNVSGVMGGNLDPTKGMYWTWQSGYINVKLEGYTNICPARKHFFQFHLGGYLPPNACMQMLVFPLKVASMATIYLPIEQFLENISLTDTYQIMETCEEAVILSKQFADSFSIDK
ncbi:MAG: MbnP family protein [Chitinophagales bacterium]|nr:hypothetical protein [Bacteroidota bacterium]